MILTVESLFNNVSIMHTINDAFAHDHRRLELALESSVAHVHTGHWDTVADRFAVFRRGIELHIAIEEELLFPAVEDGAETPLTAILRKGHRDLGVFFDELADALEARDVDEYCRVASSMGGLLERHDKKEEEELYPAVQERLGASAVAAVVARLPASEDNDG